MHLLYISAPSACMESAYITSGWAVSYAEAEKTTNYLTVVLEWSPSVCACMHVDP